MKIRIYYDTKHDFGELEYFSKYNRINAKGIKEEAKNELIKHYGKSATNYEVKDLTRI